MTTNQLATLKDHADYLNNLRGEKVRLDFKPDFSIIREKEVNEGSKYASYIYDVSIGSFNGKDIPALLEIQHSSGFPSGRRAQKNSDITLELKNYLAILFNRLNKYYNSDRLSKEYSYNPYLKKEVENSIYKSFKAIENKKLIIFISEDLPGQAYWNGEMIVLGFDEISAIGHELYHVITERVTENISQNKDKLKVPKWIGYSETEKQKILRVDKIKVFRAKKIFYIKIKELS